MRTNRIAAVGISVAMVAVAAVPAAPGTLRGERGRKSCEEPFEGVRDPDATYLLATPRGDTVPDSGGDAGFGQIAEVSRLAGAGSDGARAAAEERGVVLVPWGFDEQCRPIPWSGSWRWASVGVEGFYRGRLRPAAGWIDGRPTYDVHAAVWEGFPASPWEHPMSAGRPHLSAEQLFDLYDRLPTLTAIAARPYGAISDLVEWRRAVGELAETYPARTLVRSAFRMAETARVRSTPLPFAGTYRIRVERAADTLATFLLRTGYVGTEPIEPIDAAAGPLPAAPRPAEAFAAAAALGHLPPDLDLREDAETPSACLRALGLRAVAAEYTPEDAPRGWRAELSPAFVSACFAEVETLRNLRADSATAVLPGAFRQEADGRFTFRQAAALPDGIAVRLSGERIGLETLPSPPVIPPAAP